MGALGFPIVFWFWKLGAAAAAAVAFAAGVAGGFVCGLAKTVVAIAPKTSKVRILIGRTVSEFTRRSPRDYLSNAF
jgi:hypothetical protein